MAGILFKEETFRIIGACFEVYNDKGHGFVEPVYQACTEIELHHLAIPFSSQKELDLYYRGKKLPLTYIPDLICFDKIIVELKAVKQIDDAHRAQLINYLRATGFELGLLVNFGHHPGLQWERIVLTRQAGKENRQ